MNAGALNSNICFTGAPSCGLEETAIGIHQIAEATTSCGIPFFKQNVWIDRESALLCDGLDRVQGLFLVADAFLGARGPRSEETGFHLLGGPLDVLALAKMQRVALPPEFGKTCARLLERLQLLAFQLPDPDGWRWRGFDEQRVAWFTNYTKTLFETALESGLRLEQLRVLPRQHGDANGSVREVSWRLFGVRLNPLRVGEMTNPLAPEMRKYEAMCRETFERQSGSIFGLPLVTPMKNT